MKQKTSEPRERRKKEEGDKSYLIRSANLFL